MSRTCAQMGCDADATDLIVEGHPLAMLFRSGAGLLCERHAKDCEQVGGIRIPLTTLAELFASKDDAPVAQPTDRTVPFSDSSNQPGGPA